MIKIAVIILGIITISMIACILCTSVIVSDFMSCHQIAHIS